MSSAIFIPQGMPSLPKIIYDSRKERQKAFEDNVITLLSRKDKDGLLFHLPEVDELVNIYQQEMEDKSGS